MKQTSVKKLALIGVLSAVSIVLVMLVHFPIFPAVAFLEYDPADIPIILVTALYGPLAGLGMTASVSLIQGLTVSASGGVVGIVMHFLATGSYVLAMSLVMRAGRKKKQDTLQYSEPGNTRVMLAMIVGVAAWTVTMALWNLLFTPYFMHVTIDQLMPVYPFIIAFNVIKSAINSVVAYALYLTLKKAVFKYISH